jgi:DNA-binding transcriptional ArsR family regulator
MKKKRWNLNRNREKIIKELKENSRGFTASELSEKLDISRQTATNYFAFLEGAEKVKTRQAGMAKIYFWTKNKWKLNTPFLILVNLFILILTANIISASDVSVWQGQYYTGTTFNTGTYEFNFTVFDALTGGDICYSNTTTLTTGNFGEWKTEQTGVNSACNNISKDYYLNINLAGTDQTPRRRLVVWNSLRKDVDEISKGNLTLAGVVKANSALKIKQNIEYTNLNDEIVYSSFVQGQNSIVSDIPEIFNESLVYSKIKSLTNNYGYKVVYFDNITQKSLFTLSRDSTGRASTIFNLMVIPENKTIDSSFNLCNGKYIDCKSNEPDVLVYDDIEAIGSIFSQENITADDTGLFDYLGSLINRITKLWVVDINATGNVETSENVSAKYFKGDGSLLTNIPAGTGLTPVYLENNLTATSDAYATVFTIALTPSKMNIVHVYLAQSSNTTGVAIQNRAIVSEAGPVGMCNFITQTAAGTQAVDNILLSTNSDDTAVAGVGTNLDVPFINIVTCTVLADAGSKNLIIQFQSEQLSVVKTYAGSYYLNAVNS